MLYLFAILSVYLAELLHSRILHFRDRGDDVGADDGSECQDREEEDDSHLVALLSRILQGQGSVPVADVPPSRLALLYGLTVSEGSTDQSTAA